MLKCFLLLQINKETTTINYYIYYYNRKYDKQYKTNIKSSAVNRLKTVTHFSLINHD